MNIETVIEQMNEQAAKAAPIGGTIKFNLDGNIIYIDGTGDKNVLSTEDKDAQCLIITSIETLNGVKNGSVNPMMAAMSGKIKIKGDMGFAMKLQSLLG